jgi:hypothetical protein
MDGKLVAYIAVTVVVVVVVMGVLYFVIVRAPKGSK